MRTCKELPGPDVNDQWRVGSRIQRTLESFIAFRHGQAIAGSAISLEHIMRHNLTAVFNNQGDAQHVLEELLQSGYSRSGTRLVSPPAAGVGHTSEPGLRSAFRKVVARLLDAPRDEPERVDETAFLPGRHVITLSAATEPDSARAISIIERFSPIYVEDRRK
jgi:hypothetical protein